MDDVAAHILRNAFQPGAPSASCLAAGKPAKAGPGHKRRRRDAQGLKAAQGRPAAAMACICVHGAARQQAVRATSGAGALRRRCPPRCLSPRVWTRRGRLPEGHQRAIA